MESEKDLSRSAVIALPRFETKHILYMILCLAGAAAALYFFWRDINLTLLRLRDEPAGTVIRKQNTAQRRFEDRTLWDRLRRQSFVYSGDYIRTGEFSEAFLSLSGGELVGLGEHTLIQLLKTKDGLAVEFAGGTLEADTGEGDLVINAAGASLLVEPGSVLGAELTDTGLEAGLGAGSAVFDGGGERRTLRAGDTISLSQGAVVLNPRPGAGVFGASNGRPGRLPLVDASPPRLISPAMGEEFSFSTARPGLRFLWTSIEGAESYLLEISGDPAMANPFYQSHVEDSGGATSSVVHSGFEEGTWYWRVIPEYPRGYEETALASQTASFRIRRTQNLRVPVQQLPGRQGSLYLEDKKGEAYFSWKQEADAAFYTFLLSRSEDLSNPLISERVQNNYFVYDLKKGKLEPGQYYWGVYQTDAGGLDSASSSARSIVIMAGPPPAVPALAGVSAPPAVSSAPSAQPAAAQSAAQPASREQPSVPRELPPLPTPANLRPAPGYVLTEEIIIRDRQISFSWNAVAGASSYVFTLHQNGQEILRRSQSAARFTLTDLAILDAGTIVWRVEASAAGQKSEAAESSFIVNIAETQASRGQESGVMFGVE
jgi:hypothetical protein